MSHINTHVLLTRTHARSRTHTHTQTGEVYAADTTPSTAEPAASTAEVPQAQPNTPIKLEL